MSEESKGTETATGTASTGQETQSQSQTTSQVDALRALAERNTALQLQLDRYVAAEKAEADRKRAADEEAAARQGVDQATKYYKDELAKLTAERDAMRTQMHREAKDRAITEAVGAHKLANPASVGHLAALWSDRFETREESGRVEVREKGTGRSPSDAVKEWFASAEWMPYLAAKNASGGLSSGGLAAATGFGGANEVENAELVRGMLRHHGVVPNNDLFRKLSRASN